MWAIFLIIGIVIVIFSSKSEKADYSRRSRGRSHRGTHNKTLPWLNPTRRR